MAQLRGAPAAAACPPPAALLAPAGDEPGDPESGDDDGRDTVLAADPAALLAAGDAAWRSADRGRARCAWRAVRAATEPLDADSSDRDRALTAMARLRLLQVSGSLGMAVHGPAADAALARCTADAAWCSLAWADRAWVTTRLGLAEAEAEARAWREHARDQVAATRRAGQPVDPALDAALGRGSLAGPHPWPGTWVLGLGVVSAPGLGTGPLLRFVHPDVAWRGWRAEVAGYATTGGALRLAAGLSTRGRWWLTTGAVVERVPVPRYTLDGLRFASPQVFGTQARVGIGASKGPASAWLGPLTRVDRPEGGSWVHGHGAFGGVALHQAGSAGSLRATLSGQLAVFGPDHLGLRADLRGETPAPRGVLAGRLLTDWTPWETSPTWRQAAWGGGEVLRHAPLGRLRAPWLIGAVAEYRLAVVGPLRLVALGELAAQLPRDAAAQLHGGAGGGLRLVLPPRPVNTVRLDVAGGSLGWAVTAGWGEAF